MSTKSISAICILGLLAAGTGMADSSGSVACSQAGPQAPRDLGNKSGKNPVTFSKAPPFTKLRLCDIHFHKYAEHRAAGYPTMEGTGDHAGYVCRDHTSPTEPTGGQPSAAGCQGISEGDTVEVHWVFTSCDVEPGPGLGSCLANCVNPQLRVEGRVFYLSEGGLDFGRFTNVDHVTLPPARAAVEYLGSTTGPSFNDETCSAFQATWNVGPKCRPLDKTSLDEWCDENVFNEDHAHGVRALVTEPRLLSRIH